jgi:hypothetical protein
MRDLGKYAIPDKLSRLSVSFFNRNSIKASAGERRLGERVECRCTARDGRGASLSRFQWVAAGAAVGLKRERWAKPFRQASAPHKKNHPPRGGWLRSRWGANRTATARRDLPPSLRGRLWRRWIRIPLWPMSPHEGDRSRHLPASTGWPVRQIPARWRTHTGANACRGH